MKIYCLGIGGIGLSAYASLQNLAGHTVSGSDRSNSPLLRELQQRGIDVTFDQSGAGIAHDTDLVVYSEAIPRDAPERLKAKELGMATLSYPEAVSKLTEGYTLICVCGTHGKSSTTAMISKILLDEGLDPTIVIGTKMYELDSKNWRKGNGKYFILESCEYRRSFLHYNPLIVLLSTCDGDHFDYFKDAADYQSAFKEFVGKIPTNGSLITHLSDADCKSVSRASAGRVIDADGEPLITLNTPGLHMRQNAQLALSLARVLGISLEKAKKSLSGFAGSWRRMERKGNYQASTPVFDDYAHHPREITATLQALREQYPDRRIVCVFQPHTHDRTLKLYPQFTEAFRDANFVIIPNIYDARSDTETSEVDRTKLVEDIAKASNVECIDGHSLMETEQLLRSKILKRDDVLICMGAGDITTLASSILQ